MYQKEEKYRIGLLIFGVIFLIALIVAVILGIVWLTSAEHLVGPDYRITGQLPQPRQYPFFP